MNIWYIFDRRLYRLRTNNHSLHFNVRALLHGDQPHDQEILSKSLHKFELPCIDVKSIPNTGLSTNIPQLEHCLLEFRIFL